jgi:hypothetical protein
LYNSNQNNSYGDGDFSYAYLIPHQYFSFKNVKKNVHKLPLLFLVHDLHLRPHILSQKITQKKISMLLKKEFFFLQGSSTLIGATDSIDFQKSCTPMTLKMYHMSL